MSLTELRVVGVLGFVIVGVVATIGAVALSLLVSGAVQASLTVAGWLGRIRFRAAEAGGHVATTVRTPAADGGFRLDAADHALLARQAWWRLRC